MWAEGTARGEALQRRPAAEAFPIWLPLTWPLPAGWTVDWRGRCSGPLAHAQKRGTLARFLGCCNTATLLAVKTTQRCCPMVLEVSCPRGSSRANVKVSARLVPPGGFRGKAFSSHYRLWSLHRGSQQCDICTAFSLPPAGTPVITGACLGHRPFSEALNHIRRIPFAM